MIMRLDGASDCFEYVSNTGNGATLHQKRDGIFERSSSLLISYEKPYNCLVVVIIGCFQAILQLSSVSPTHPLDT